MPTECALAGLVPPCAIVSCSKYCGILSAALIHQMFCCIWHLTPVLVDAVPVVSVSQLFRWHHLQAEVLYFHIKPGTTLLPKYKWKRICEQCPPKQTHCPRVIGLEAAQVLWSQMCAYKPWLRRGRLGLRWPVPNSFSGIYFLMTLDR